MSSGDGVESPHLAHGRTSMKSIRKKLKTKPMEHREIDDDGWLRYMHQGMRLSSNDAICRLGHYLLPDGQSHLLVVVDYEDILPSTSIFSAAKLEVTSMGLLLSPEKSSVISDFLDLAENKSQKVDVIISGSLRNKNLVLRYSLTSTVKIAYTQLRDLVSPNLVGSDMETKNKKQKKPKSVFGDFPV